MPRISQKLNLRKRCTSTALGPLVLAVQVLVGQIGRVCDSHYPLRPGLHRGLVRPLYSDDGMLIGRTEHYERGLMLHLFVLVVINLPLS